MEAFWSHHKEVTSSQTQFSPRGQMPVSLKGTVVMPMLLSMQKVSNPASSFLSSECRESLRVGGRHASTTSLVHGFWLSHLWILRKSLRRFTFWFFPTRQEGVYIQWEAEVCRLFSVPEEEMGHWLSSKVQLSGLGTDAWQAHWWQTPSGSGQDRLQL